MQIQKIYKGKVAAYRESDQPNIMWVTVGDEEDADAKEVQVIYTSPVHQRHYYGFFALPPYGSVVLVAYDGFKYYYLSTIVDYDQENGSVSKIKDTDKKLPLFSDKKMVGASGIPATLMLKNEYGAGIDIKNYMPKMEGRTPLEPLMSRVEVRSGDGHRLLLGDSPNENCVILENKNHDGIMIGGNVPFSMMGQPGIPYAEGQIRVVSTQDHICTVKKGSYQLTIKDGRDISLTNESKGLNALFAPDPTAPPSVTSRPFLWYGNVNLVSKFRDINIYTDNPIPGAVPPAGFSNIYISTSNGLIQIKSGGDIVIHSTGGTTIQSLGNLNLISNAGAVNIQGQLGVNVNSVAGDVNIQGLQANVAGTASTNLGSGGSPVTLNSVVQEPIIPLIPVIPAFNVYGK